ncbi:MAG: CPBP family intramembrane metalloprotease [Rhodospirillaceae bacterium]|nr:CPBP family intramembrane metalloprotease [Rhodospirillaceae bacterium]
MNDFNQAQIPQGINIKSHKAWALIALLVVGPGLINNLLNIDNENYQSWLVYDYAFRIVQLIIIYFYPPFREAVSGAIFNAMPRLGGLLAALFAALLVLSAYQLSGLFFYDLFGGAGAVSFKYPEIEHSGIKLFDLTFGLALVAVSEEIIYRALLAALVFRYLPGTFWVVVLSSVIFAFIHWAHGPSNVIAAFVSGVIFMILYLRTRSLLPPMLAHYIANFVHFF